MKLKEFQVKGNEPKIIIKEPELEIVSLSKLALFSWDRLKHLSRDYGIENEFYDNCKSTENKEDLIVEIRRMMRIKKLKEKTEGYN